MSRKFARCSLAAAMSLVWLAPLVAQEAVRPTLAAKLAPTAQQLQAWVRDLEADEFLARETAMLNLVAAGKPAVAALKSVFPSNSRETTSRALFVLQQLGLSPDPEVQELACEALVELAATKENANTARQAQVALDWVTEQRSVQALAELEALGAKIVRSQNFNGFAVEEVIDTIELGDDFKGQLQDLRRLKWLGILRVVLTGEKVTDEWLPHAAAMAELEEIHLYKTKVTSEGLLALKDHASLQQVGIYYCPLDDAALAALEKLPALNFIKLYGTSISTGGVAKFQEKTGLTKVDHRRGAFLGVGCMNLDGACLISTVHPKSPAEEAGLMQDDLLVRFGDSRVSDFESLTAQISQLDAGAEVEIEVQRQIEDENGRLALKNLVLKAKLAPWSADLAVKNGPRP